MPPPGGRFPGTGSIDVFYDSGLFPFALHLETEWKRIQSEFDALQGQGLVPWPERVLYDQGWSVFGLYAFGREIPENCGRCPDTVRLLARVPGLVTAGFSVMAPGTHIRPHVGYSDAVLRCHLGIRVSKGCALRVAGVVRQWEEGRTLVFDDTREHEAWNRGASPRAVLLMDFLKPGARASDEVPVTVRRSLARATQNQPDAVLSFLQELVDEDARNG